MRIRAAAVLALLAALALAASALARPPRTQTLNLDRDPEPEQLVVRDIVSGDPPYQLTQETAVVQDTCNGQPAAFDLTSAPEDAVVNLKARELDGGITPQKEIWVEALSGAGGRVGVDRVLRYDACAAPRVLFSYDPRHARKPPRGYAVSSWAISFRDRTRRYSGKEIRLDESLAGRRDPLCCASRRRTTLFGYNAGRDRYVAYSRKIVKVKRRK
jgi:hypothetical protein